MKRKRIIIIGGGASGMMAAISAKRMGADVTILEHNPRVGKKILATGNGRCNFTNVEADISCYYGHNPKFAYSTLASFSVEDTICFFEKLGIAHKVEDLGKVYPMSDQASSILDVLLYELSELKVKIVCDAFVKGISKTNNTFNIELENGQTYKGDRVIIATGGKALPSSGSDGSGYYLAEALGHSIVNIFPSLVQLKLEGSFFKQISGVKFVGSAEVLQGNKVVGTDRGDILFTNYGVSGPPILQLSRQVGKILEMGRTPILKLTLIDTFNKTELQEMMMKRFQNASRKPIDFSLVGLINKRLIPVVLKQAGINDLKTPVKDITLSSKENIINLLTDWRFEITGTKGWASAQVTAGGVDTKDIDQKTMESKIITGLYFAGEVVDIDGRCGGYNLQWAWSSGFVAGQNAALS